MAKRLNFDDKEQFLEALRGLREEGHSWQSLRIHLPYSLPEIEEILDSPPSRVRFFAVVGGVTGFVSGLALTIYSVTSWPLITGGKPIISIPPFLLIGYILTILFGALATFIGFLLLARLPDPHWFRSPEEFGNQFVIIIEDGGPS